MNRKNHKRQEKGEEEYLACCTKGDVSMKWNRCPKYEGGREIVKVIHLQRK